MTPLEHVVFPHISQEVFQTVFPNGFRLVILPKPGFKETVAMLKVSCGSIDNTLTMVDNVVNLPYGTAHFLEHQVFENKGKEDYSQLFTKLGADSNAFTGFTATTYYFSGVGQMTSCLDLLQDLVTEKRFTEASLLKEKSIIKQEIDMYQDDPDYRLYGGILAQLFPNTPLAYDIAGNHKFIEEITDEVLHNVFDYFYQPHRMTMVVVGDVDPDEIYTVVNSKQAKIDNRCQSSLQLPIDYNAIVPKGTLQMDVTLPKLAIGFRLQPCQGDWVKQRLALRLYLNMILGWTSKTYQDWYDAGKIDDSFDIQFEVSDRFQFVLILLDTKEPIAMAAKLKQVLKNNRANKDISEEHLYCLKKEIYGDFITSLDKIEELASLYLDFDRPGESYLNFPDYLTDLTLDDVVSIGQEAFNWAEIAEFTIFPR